MLFESHKITNRKLLHNYGICFVLPLNKREEEERRHLKNIFYSLKKAKEKKEKKKTKKTYTHICPRFPKPENRKKKKC